MCLPFTVFVLQVLTVKCATSFPYKDFIVAYIPVEELAYLQNIEAIPVPYYNNALFNNPWSYQRIMMRNARSPYRQTIGPVTFGGQTKAKGAVTITGGFGNQGYGSFTSYSAPPTPLMVTSEPSLLTTSSLLMDTKLPTAITLPTITALPAVTLPPIINQPFTDPMPSTVSVPAMPMPFIVVTTTLPADNDYLLNGNLASPVKFNGMVPASGRVKISAHFC